MSVMEDLVLARIYAVEKYKNGLRSKYEQRNLHIIRR